MREEVIADRVSNVLGRLTFGDAVLQWVTTALRESHQDERKEHEEAIARLQAEYERLHQRINAMYLDKLDGKIDASFFDRTSAGWRKEQARCTREISWHQSAK